MPLLFVLVTLILSLGSAQARVQPSDLNLPAGPLPGGPESDCQSTLLDWDFAAEKIVGRTKEYLFLMIDRYGGTREMPDYRGAMCRVHDMEEVWAVSELFPTDETIAFTDDGRYFVNAIGRAYCGEEDYDYLSRLDVLTFYDNGEVLKTYTLDELLPSWREVCAEEGDVLRWLDSSYRFFRHLSEDNATLTFKTADGKTHEFSMQTGKPLFSPENPD